MTNRLCHEIIGDLQAGMCAFYDWNLLLDEKGGPNHVGNYCHAPFLYDTAEHKLMPQKTQEQFYMFSHLSFPDLCVLLPQNIQSRSMKWHI